MLTVLEEKLGEAHALAMAATTVAATVAERISERALRLELQRMHDEARELRARCLAVENTFDEETAGEILAHAQTTSEKASDLLGAWLKAGTSPLAAWSFLAMGEAAEVAVWRALRVLADAAGSAAVAELVDWALPVQERHLQIALEGATRLAELADPLASRWG